MDFTLVYKLFTGSKTKFANTFGDEIADAFWSKLNTVCLLSIIFLLVVTFGLCMYYFTKYNEQPGRHYKPSHWIGFYLGAILSTFILTVVLGYFIAKPLPETSGPIWMIGVGNLVYSIILFGIVSCVWWKWLPTNAYKLI